LNGATARSSRDDTATSRDEMARVKVACQRRAVVVGLVRAKRPAAHKTRNDFHDPVLHIVKKARRDEPAASASDTSSDSDSDSDSATSTDSGASDFDAEHAPAYNSRVGKPMVFNVKTASPPGSMRGVVATPSNAIQKRRVATPSTRLTTASTREHYHNRHEGNPINAMKGEFSRAVQNLDALTVRKLLSEKKLHDLDRLFVFGILEDIFAKSSMDATQATHDDINSYYIGDIIVDSLFPPPDGSSSSINTTPPTTPGEFKFDDFKFDDFGKSEIDQRTVLSALHEVPRDLLVRDLHAKSILDFVLECAGKGFSGSLHLYGQVGSGKTTTIRKVLQSLTAFGNVNVTTTHGCDATFDVKKLRNCYDESSYDKSKTNVFFLDEVEHMKSAAWIECLQYAYSNHSVIISAGNKCLDEIFQKSAQRQEAPPPHELCFKAYTAPELEVLLRQRLSTVGYKVLEDKTFEIICKRNANRKGDLRSLLASCDRAIRKHSDKNNSVPLALFKEDTRPAIDSLPTKQRVLLTFFKDSGLQSFTRETLYEQLKGTNKIPWVTSDFKQVVEGLQTQGFLSEHKDNLWLID